MFNCETIKLAM